MGAGLAIGVRRCHVSDVHRTCPAAVRVVVLSDACMIRPTASALEGPARPARALTTPTAVRGFHSCGAPLMGPASAPLHPARIVQHLVRVDHSGRFQEESWSECAWPRISSRPCRCRVTRRPPDCDGRCTTTGALPTPPDSATPGTPASQPTSSLMVICTSFGLWHRFWGAVAEGDDVVRLKGGREPWLPDSNAHLVASAHG